MIQEVNSTLDILNKNKKCLFCSSDLILMSELALTKLNPSFTVNNNYLNFKVDLNYFLYARIDLKTDEFQIEKLQNPALFTNYKSINFYRKCVFCKYDFTIKYTKYKFKEHFGSTKLDYVDFKYIDINNKDIYFVSNNHNDNYAKIKYLSYESNYFLQLKNEYKFDNKIDFDYSDIDSIHSKLKSISLFA
jgi:hypothetical protein